MIGMTSTKIWKLLDTLTLRDTISADVEFNEYEFPKIDISLFTLPDRPDVLTSRQVPLERTKMYQPQMIEARQKGVKQARKNYAAIRPMEAMSWGENDSELQNPVTRLREAEDASDQRYIQKAPIKIDEQETYIDLVELQML